MHALRVQLANASIPLWKFVQPRIRRKTLSQCTTHDGMVETNLDLQSRRPLEEREPRQTRKWALGSVGAWELGWRMAISRLGGPRPHGHC